MKLTRIRVILAIIAISSASSPARAADLMDAPGPGYRMHRGEIPAGQIERLQLVPRPARPASRGGAEAWFLRTHPPLKKESDAWHAERAKSSFEEELHRLTAPGSLPTFRDEQPARDLSWLASELLKLTGALPEFPRDDVFSTPRNLFGAP